MSEAEIKDLDKRLTGVEATIAPLLKELRGLTESNVHLTSEIKHMVKTVEKTLDDHEKLERRVTENEKEIAVIKSKTSWQDNAGRAIIGTLVTLILGAVVYSIKGGS